MLPHNRFKYRPPFWAKNPVTQTTLARSPWRTMGANRMLAHSVAEVFTTEDGVRLQGYYSRQESKESRGLVLLLHGWEGSVRSAYMLTGGRLLYKRGYDVFRLNFRDHGGTHHLNEGLFHGALLDEVADVLSQVARRNGHLPITIVGYSLGGNYALRLACRDLPHVRRVVAVSPVLYPRESSERMDAHPLFGRYFREKWTNSLRKKEALFPLRYNFSDVYEAPVILEMTLRLLRKYTPFPTLEDYFEQYTLTPEWLQNVLIPSHIISSVDDPVVANGDYDRYRANDALDLCIQQYGGHVGFIGPFLRRSWYETVLLELLAEQG